MNFLKKTLMSFAVTAAFLTIGQHSAQAQAVQFGGHAGAMGLGSQTKVGFGADLVFVPGDLFGLWVDGTFASFKGVNYFSTSPSLLVYAPVGSDELKVGGLLGVGFHKVQHVDMKFGLNLGAFADFYVAPNFTVGAMGRYQPIIDFNDGWGVFLTVKLAFTTGSSW